MAPLSELKRIAARKSIALGVIEKDYAITWILCAVSESPLKDRLVFKGGTALRKAYFSGWRFSEDLDFTATCPLTESELRDFIGMIGNYAAEKAGISIRITSLHTNQEYAQIKVQFTGPMNSKNTIKLDFSFNEQVILPPRKMKILSEYSDKGEHSILVYPLEEILAEKIRSILQRAKTRDYYDVWMLLKEHHARINPGVLHDVLIKKCKLKSIDFKKDHLFISSRIKPAEGYWKSALAHQITDLPDFKIVVKECKDLVDKLLKP